MKVQIMSDLHIRHWIKHLGPDWFESKFLPDTETGADVLVLAGDIGSFMPQALDETIARLTEFGLRYRHVIYVPGNHEYYGTSIEAGMEALLDRSWTTPGLQVLYSGHTVTIDNQRFIGDTMWQPHSGRFAELAKDISDHWCIDDFRTQAPQEFAQFNDFLGQQLNHDDIVVTHHAPSMQSVAGPWIGHPCNRWFVTPEVEPLILERQPRYWIHGHTHTSFDYRLGSTRVLCNPLGYTGEGVAFNPKLVIEVP